MIVKRNPRIIKRKNAPGELIQLTQATTELLREYLYEHQNGICPILGRKVDLSQMALDHKHKLKVEKPGPNGKGLVRGVIHNQINSFEGMIVRKWKKQGLMNIIPLPVLLIKLGKYLMQPPCPQIYIHHKEKPKAPTFGIRDYKRIKKYYFVIFPRRKKMPPYPKSGIKKVGKPKKGKKQKYKYVAKLSSKWKKLLDAANEIHNRKKR